MVISMAQVNFMKELFAFHIYAKAKSLSLAEFGLWWALFYLFNEAANGTEWPEGFLSFSNKEVLAQARFGEDTLIRARKTLAKRGIIDYKQGRKNKLCPQYRMNYLTVASESYPQAVDNVPQFASNMRGNIAGYIRGNPADNTGDNRQGNGTDIPLNLNVSVSKPFHTDCGYDGAWRTSARVRNAVAQRILDKWDGDKSGGFDIHYDLVDAMEYYGMSPATIERVLQNCDSAVFVHDHLETAAIDLRLIPDPNDNDDAATPSRMLSV